MKTTLAVKYRPKSFKELIGQEYIKEVLQNQIKNNNLGKSYLYTGPSGVGKTTVARIFASNIDSEVIEIDAASNSGVDNVRSISENAKYKPLNNNYKVYIIDECHMLSKGAWNALLKILEEPPKHVIFILATTEPHKVPTTIISRSQRFNFTKPSKHLIQENLLNISKSENFKVKDSVLSYISKLADGGVRLSITMLEACMNVEQEINVEEVEKVLGHIPTKYFIEILEAVSLRDREKIFTLVNKYHYEGLDFNRFTEQIVMFVLDLHKYAVTRDMQYLRTSSMYEDDIKDILNNLVKDLDNNVEKLQRMLDYILKSLTYLYYSSFKLEPKRYLLECVLIDLTKIKKDSL